MARGKICTITSRNLSSRVCPVDFDGRREMSSLSLKTVVVHKSVTSLMMETNFRKGGLIHRVPRTKSCFRVYACSFVNINTVTCFNLFLCPFKQRDMSVMRQSDLLHPVRSL